MEKAKMMEMTEELKKETEEVVNKILYVIGYNEYNYNMTHEECYIEEMDKCWEIVRTIKENLKNNYGYYLKDKYLDRDEILGFTFYVWEIV